METNSRSVNSLAGQRRPRPHSYTTQACDRCRSRKQRCVLSDDSDNICRNCVESQSECMFSKPPDRSKRSRGESMLSRRNSGEEEPASTDPSNSQSHDTPDRAIPVPNNHRQQHKSDVHTSMSFSPGIPSMISESIDSAPHYNAVPSISALSRSMPAQSLQPDFDWQAWLVSLSGQQRAELPTPPQQQNIDTSSHRRQISQPQIIQQPHVLQSQPFPPSGSFSNPLQSINIASIGASVPSQPSSTLHSSLPSSSSSSTTLPVQSAPTPPINRNFGISHRLPTSPASGIESDEGSLEDAAKGLAMISLEAAAEPHYVGESSGSLWTTVISGGMHSQPRLSQLGEMPKRPGGPSTHRKSAHSNTTKGENSNVSIRQAIQQPIAAEIATSVLETVFRHLHPRYPFMDWVAFEKQWEAKDDILLAVGQGLPLDRQSSTAAFFILMILAVGAQLTKERPLPGLLRAEDYYDLAFPYMNVIVTLHNLPNIQGLLLLAIYSLRDSKGPSVWYLSGVTLRLCIGMGLHRNAAGWAVRNLTKYEIEMRKRVFWSCYTIDRMISLLLGRPPGISDDDLDVDLPEIFEPSEKPKLKSMQVSSMASAIHHIKLKCIESRIQRSVYGIKRQGNPQAIDYWDLLNDLDEWENTIPLEASSPDYWTYPSCSKDWFLLKGVEARLHLLRPLCAEGQSAGAVFVPHLATHAARGCEIQKRMHQQGQPMSNASAHSAFICGLALLYALFLQPKVMALKDVFRAIKATSNTLFAYTQASHHSAEVLYDVFEDLSAACIEHISKRETAEAANGIPDRRNSVDEWQKASSQATSNIDPNTAGEYVNILQTLGISVGGDHSEEASYTQTQPLWDLAAFSPGNLFPLNNNGGSSMGI